MSQKKREKLLKSLDTKIEGDEISFLKHLTDYCENILENEEIMNTSGFTPPVIQLVKLRVEVSKRLERLYGIK